MLATATQESAGQETADLCEGQSDQPWGCQRGSSKYPKAVNQFATRSNRPVQGSSRMSPSHVVDADAEPVSVDYVIG